ncbi:Ring canal kelch-like protein [Bienertia sinuspersici]
MQWQRSRAGLVVLGWCLVAPAVGEEERDVRVSTKEMIDKIRDLWITYVFNYKGVGDEEEDDMEVVK